MSGQPSASGGTDTCVSHGHRQGDSSIPDLNFVFRGKVNCRNPHFWMHDGDVANDRRLFLRGVGRDRGTGQNGSEQGDRQ